MNKELEKLTPGEREVFDRLVDGQTGNQIATALGICRGTVHNTARNIYRQLGVPGRIELIKKYYVRDK